MAKFVFLDQFGEDGLNGHSGGGGPGGSANFNSTNIDPHEIFNMMFGSGKNIYFYYFFLLAKKLLFSNKTHCKCCFLQRTIRKIVKQNGLYNIIYIM